MGFSFHWHRNRHAHLTKRHRAQQRRRNPRTSQQRHSQVQLSLTKTAICIIVTASWLNLTVTGGRMVDETLKRLLDAEAKAEQIVARADEERQAIIEQAKHDARIAEQQQAERMAEIHADFLAQAEQRAEQTIAALQKHHAEQAKALRVSAQRNEQQALAEAVALLTGMDRS